MASTNSVVRKQENWTNWKHSFENIPLPLWLLILITLFFFLINFFIFSNNKAVNNVFPEVSGNFLLLFPFLCQICNPTYIFLWYRSDFRKLKQDFIVFFKTWLLSFYYDPWCNDSYVQTLKTILHDNYFLYLNIFENPINFMKMFY